MLKSSGSIPSEIIDKRILLIRGEKVMLDNDLAELYGVKTKRLLEAVKRNMRRFPQDFMFQLSFQEVRNLRSHFATSSLQLPEITKEAKNVELQPEILGKSNHDWGGRRTPPYVFTEQGVAMLSGVLNSARAISVNVEIMRAFVRLRQMISSHTELASKLEALEKKYDSNFRVVFEAIRELMKPPEPKKKQRIGF